MFGRLGIFKAALPIILRQAAVEHSFDTVAFKSFSPVLTTVSLFCSVVCKVRVQVCGYPPKLFMIRILYSMVEITRFEPQHKFPAFSEQ